MAFCRLLNFTEVPLEHCNLIDKVEKRVCRSHIPCLFKLFEEVGECKGTCGMNGTRDVQLTCRESVTQRSMNLSFCGVQLKANSTQSCVVPVCNTTKAIQDFEWRTGQWSRVSAVKKKKKNS